MNMAAKIRLLVLYVAALATLTACPHELPKEVLGTNATQNVTADQTVKVESEIKDDFDNWPKVWNTEMYGRMDKRQYIFRLCQKISSLKRRDLKVKYYNQVIDTVLSIRFEDIGEVPKDYRPITVREQEGCGMYNMSEFRWRLFHAQVDLVCIFQGVDNFLQKESMPLEMRLDAIFRFLEKMRTEKRRLKVSFLAGIDRVVGSIEGRLDEVREAMNEEDREKLNARFKKAFGRKLRTRKQIESDYEDTAHPKSPWRFLTPWK